MKQKFTLRACSLMLIAFVTIFQGCFKDSATRTYTIFIPVYKSVQDVRAAIKSNAPQPVQNPGKIFVLGDYIFLNEIDKGVHIIDNTNPSAPVNKYFIDIPGNLDLAVKGHTLYADLYRDLVTIDIANPAAIQVKKITENVFPARSYSNWFVGDTTKVIVDWLQKDTTVAVSNDYGLQYQYSPDVLFFNGSSTAASAISTKSGVSGSMARFTLLTDYLYTVTNTELNAFNVSQPENPVYTSKVTVGWQIETIYPFGNKLFIGSKTGIFIVNTSNPAQPVVQSQFSHITMCDPIIADNDYAYVTLSSGTDCHGTFNELDILNIQDIDNPVQLTTYQLTNPHGLSKSGNNLFVCDGASGLKVFDASDVHNLKLLQNMTGIDAYDVITQDNNAIVVAKDGLYQYDYSNVKNVTLRSKLTVNRFK